VLLTTAACATGAAEHRTPDDAPPAAAAPSPGASPPADQARVRPSARDVVHHPDAVLAEVSVRRRDDAWQVRGLWVVNRRWSRQVAYVASADGFRTATHRRGGYSRLHRLMGPGPLEPRALPDGWPAQAPGMAHLLPQPVPSLAQGVRAVVGGGDGATLLPFQAVARSVDAGSTWVAHDLPLFGGARAYTAGQVVTSDGRLVTLLDHFSDDRAGRPASRHHGLWASLDGDWTAYRPLRVRLAPDQEPAPRGWSTVVEIAASTGAEPFLWVRTWDSRVYVSTDDARTFREIPVR
jgi:hypothetical protein